MTDAKLATRKFRLPIRITVVSIFILATLLTASLAVGLQYYFSRNSATLAATTRFYDLADSTGQYLTSVNLRAAETARILASYPGLVQNDWVNEDVRNLFATLMRDSPMLYAIYLGFDNGDFYEVINLESSPAVREQLQAEADDRWVVIVIRDDGDQRIRRFDYFSQDFHFRHQRSEPSEYNAAKRPWFVQATEGVVTKSAPYLFHNLQAPGQTFSTRIDGAVIAVDIALSSLSEYLSTRQTQDFGRVFIYRKTGELVASNGAERTERLIPAATPLVLDDEERTLVEDAGVLRVSNERDWAPVDFSVSGEPRGYSIDYLNIISQLTGLRFEYVNGYSWNELVDLFKASELDLLQPIFDNGAWQLPGEFSTPFLNLSYSLVSRQELGTMRHIRELAGKTIAVPSGWSIIKVLQAEFPAVHILQVESTRAIFEAVQNGSADAGLDVGEIIHYTGDQYHFRRLRYHDDISFAPVAFPTELHVMVHDRQLALLPVLNRAISAVTQAQKNALAAKWFHGPAQYQDMLTVPYSELVDLAAQPDQQNRLVPVTINGKPHFIFVKPFSGEHTSEDYLGVVVPVAQVLNPALEKVRLSVLLTVGFLLILIPAPWLFSSPIVSPIKKLAEENEKIRRRQYAHLEIPSSYIREIDELGRSMAAMVDAIRMHEANQIALMDAFIQLIAQAIDDKSHYTAGHCERVPELAFMLAEKAEQSQMPAFKDFRFGSKDEWREFRVAAWLHDCGKITTPEHIVDKGSKLETIYNRIHEIRTRFEVLWRDAELEYWRKLVDNPGARRQYQNELEEKRQQLKTDFEFLAAMNVGGEYLSEDKKVRLNEIGKTTWQRHFSDRLGLSPLEESRLQGPEPSLPCEETLLVDRPEHIIPRDHDTHYPSHLGIKMDIPEHLYNQGEFYNLCIERGTLTAEDRFKINEHIISTIRMLDALPFPDELARVPRYASTHHETMKGSGYPRRLKGEELSIPERIMVLADIFEALTAADRPYKKAKPVSVAIDILAKMVADEHVDAEVFELFLRSRVYADYATRYLPEHQLDDVDIEQYLRGD